MIQKHQFKQVAAFAGLYFLAIGLGVLLGSLVDHRGNMFYAPAFSALVEESIASMLRKFNGQELFK